MTLLMYSVNISIVHWIITYRPLNKKQNADKSKPVTKQMKRIYTFIYWPSRFRYSLMNISFVLRIRPFIERAPGYLPK